VEELSDVTQIEIHEAGPSRLEVETASAKLNEHSVSIKFWGVITGGF
jgi:hypothetical protein